MTDTLYKPNLESLLNSRNNKQHRYDYILEQHPELEKRKIYLEQIERKGKIYLNDVSIPDIIEAEKLTNLETFSSIVNKLCHSDIDIECLANFIMNSKNPVRVLLENSKKYIHNITTLPEYDKFIKSLM